MLDKVIITCAVTGSTMDALRINPAVPVTPKQIADEVAAAHAADAAGAHIHVGDPETGQPSMAFHLYEEVGTYVGLFGASAGTISNIALTGAGADGSQIGGLIGVNTGSVTGVYATGTATGGGGAGYGGGLIGSNGSFNGSVTSLGVAFTQAYATGT